MFSIIRFNFNVFFGAANDFLNVMGMRKETIAPGVQKMVWWVNGSRWYVFENLPTGNFTPAIVLDLLGGSSFFTKRRLRVEVLPEMISLFNIEIEAPWSLQPFMSFVGSKVYLVVSSPSALQAFDWDGLAVDMGRCFALPNDVSV
ncbi:MAG: hypothetical protein ABI747_04625 [Candidatus Moraniibacteriota bacterium]